MAMTDATLVLVRGGARKSVSLADYLTPAGEARAHQDEYAWIKGLRHAKVDGQSFRQRFTARGDSLWWFTEIYLHKERVVLDVYRTIAAMESLVAIEAPESLEVFSASGPAQHVIGLAATSLNVRTNVRTADATWWRRIASLDLRARRLTLSAYTTRDRFRRAPAAPSSPRVAAFIHRAFWRAGGDEGSAESYIGPVLSELERRAGAAALRYIGVGPPTNFRERRRWRIEHAGRSAVVPVEQYAPLSRLVESRHLWRKRYQFFRVLTQSDSLREAARMRGIDCWPLIREQLAGVAWLQWPWSVRAMDEAAAALDALKPASVLTYAEAGGWGRALVLEARRREIPSVGLQHGFIYRHWLNYLHEEDEMDVAGETKGFPVPTATLVFDDYAADHLQRKGHYAANTLRVTGSPKLDALFKSLQTMPAGAVESARREAHVSDQNTLVLVTTKQREARDVLPTLLSAAEQLPNVTLLIKPHPAENTSVYDGVVSGRSNVRVLPATAPLAPLLAASRALVTVNSTLALDAAVVGIPALVIGLPNNLSPFVDAGVLAGAESAAEIAGQLHRILYDEGFRQQLERARRGFLERYAMRADGQAAARSAEAVLEVARK